MFEYHRNSKRRPIGVVTAIVVANEVRFGWSLCSKMDKFEKEFGLQLAEARALKYTPKELEEEKFDLGSKHAVPESMQKHLVDFSLRADRYYQDKDVIVFEFVG